MGRDSDTDLDRSRRRAVLAGDAEAWTAWFQANYDILYRYIHWRSGGLEDWTDELVQETWLTAVRRIRSFDPAQGSFLAWMRGIAGNLIRNRLRQRSRTAKVECCCAADDSMAQPERNEVRARAQRVIEVLAELPDQYEAVLRAKYLEGRAIADIAASRGHSTKAIESLLTRARHAFRRLYCAAECESKEDTHA